jgi:hypothetical protein
MVALLRLVLGVALFVGLIWGAMALLDRMVTLQPREISTPVIVTRLDGARLEWTRLP